MLMRSVALFVASIALIFETSGARPQPANPTPVVTIRWEVANRFRLFRDEAQFRAIADIFDSLGTHDLSSRSALQLERELEARAATMTLGSAFGDPRSVRRYGWASAVVGRTCFQNGNRGHGPCRLANGDDYLSPRRADLLIRLEPAPAGQCTWSLTGLPPVEAPCDRQARFKDISFDQRFSIAVAQHGLAIARLDDQAARSVVIVGMGDSFSSGEGNPDRPAVLGDDFDSYDRSSLLPGEPAFGQARQFPLRVGSSPRSLSGRAAAIWLNAQCHRSLYSQHAKAALQLALEQPHIAVTFLGYSCTGAEITEGILGYWKGRDDVPERYYDSSPQLMRFLRDVCSDPRPYRKFWPGAGEFHWTDMPRCAERRIGKVDALLLSIGGNDVGFSNMIANEMVDSTSGFSSPRRLLYRLWLRAAEPISFEDGEKNARVRLPGRIADLSEALRTHVGIQPAAILQTAYPHLTKLRDGKECGVTTDGMDVHQILGIGKTTTGRAAAAFVVAFNHIIRDSIAALGARAWTLVDGHVDAFEGHALCQGGAEAGDPEGGISGGMRFPAWDFERSRWEPFSPSSWVAYGPRQRWFVTPNDAFLTGNYMNVTDGTTDPRDKVQPLFAATLSGAFHPNALGHAAVADAILPKLREAVRP